MLTKKHFEVFADCFKRVRPNPEDHLPKSATDQWRNMVNAFCDGAVSINPRFDPDVFRKACGYHDVLCKAEVDAALFRLRQLNTQLSGE